MQLVAYGAQDIYLTGNPQITFFKVVYRRHTNFSMECIQQTINGTSTLSSTTGNGTVTISRNGDLVHKVYVTVSGSTTIQKGSNIVSEVELEIGGQRIDRHYEEWNNIWNELTIPASKGSAFKSMISDVGLSGRNDSVSLVQVPLNFWFCRNPGLALPLIALQYHEVKLKFTWGRIASKDGASSTCNVFCDYIYLDTDERRRFAQVSHEYLIEQVQKQSCSAGTSQKLNFNHPVKEIIWTSNAVNSYTDAKLVLNGHDRFSAQEEEYFQLRQPFDYHTSVPRQNLPLISHGTYITRATQLRTPHTIDITAAVSSVPGPSDINFVLINGRSDFEDPAGGVTNADTNPTRILAILGTTAGTVFPKNSLAVGREHIIEIIHSADAVAGANKILVRIDGLFFDETSGAGTIPTDGTGPVAAGEELTPAETTASTYAVGVLYILYSEFISTSQPVIATDYVEIETINSEAMTSQMHRKINVYSFSLKPEEHQPSGTCNFSRIDTAKLVTGDNLSAFDNIYAVNYNVLRIMSGMGGLAYSN